MSPNYLLLWPQTLWTIKYDHMYKKFKSCAYANLLNVVAQASHLLTCKSNKTKRAEDAKHTTKNMSHWKEHIKSSAKMGCFRRIPARNGCLSHGWWFPNDWGEGGGKQSSGRQSLGCQNWHCTTRRLEVGTNVRVVNEGQLLHFGSLISSLQWNWQN